jgi:hypothetical protein
MILKEAHKVTHLRSQARSHRIFMQNTHAATGIELRPLLVLRVFAQNMRATTRSKLNTVGLTCCFLTTAP